MKSVRKYRNRRCYFVPQDKTLFKVDGAKMRESFNDLRSKTKELEFKSISNRDASYLEKTGQVDRVINLIEK